MGIFDNEYICPFCYEEVTLNEIKGPCPKCGKIVDKNIDVPIPANKSNRLKYSAIRGLRDQLLRIEECQNVIIESLQSIDSVLSEKIKLGDYVQMGTYYGEPILWRCVAFYRVDGNGNVDLTNTSREYKYGYLPLMLTDRIICLKEFDAPGTNIIGSHRNDFITKDNNRQENGSNFWGDSNIRCWLNSSESAGNVKWDCGNPPAYVTEAGFLRNFNSGEWNAIREVNQYTNLYKNEYHASIMKRYGKEIHIHNEHNIECAVQNANDGAYKKSFSDKMFLMDVNQVYEVYKNSDVLGENYYIGAPTEKCIHNCSSSSYTDFEFGKKWFYWLRSPRAYVGEDYYVYDVGSNGTVYYNKAYYASLGVRAAFYLNLKAISFEAGDGSLENPYQIL